MANYELLHSGEFLGTDDRRIRVSFYKIYHLKAYPNYLYFDQSGGSLRVSIWDTKGSARLGSNPPSWLTYRQVSAEQLPGSQYYKYTYEISCSSNSGSGRGYDWPVNVEDGPEAGYASINFRVWQNGTSQSNVSVSPNYLTLNGSGQTANIGFTNMPMSGLTPEITYYDGSDWMSVQIIRNSGTVTAARNTGNTDRTAVVTFRDNTNRDNYTTLRVVQTATSLFVSPTYIRYVVGGGTNGITATWTRGSQPTYTIEYETSDTGWLVPTGAGIVDGNTISWAWTAQQNTTLVERRARITVDNGWDTVVVEVMQNRQ